MRAEVTHIASRDNPLLVRLRRLVGDSTAYRRLGVVWLEGDHLCRALLARGRPPLQAVVTDAAWHDAGVRALAQAAPRVAVVPERLFKGLSSLESPASIGFLHEPGAAPPLDPDASAVVLDRVQDAGNVGSLLRSAAAFGVTQVLALGGSAALWSPKVLRAGMGAHFALSLHESLQVADLRALRVPMVVTSSHAAATLHESDLPHPCAWVFGHEGQGVQDSITAHGALVVRVPQPGGEESLNVAAAGAVCLYESWRRRAPVTGRGASGHR